MIYSALILASVALFLLCLGRTIYLVAKRQFSSRHVSVYLVLLGFYLSIFFLRLAVGIYLHRMDFENYGCLNAFELTLDSGVHALQSFSMDEDYTLYLATLRTLARAICPLPLVATVAGGLSAVQNLAAPVVGGAILLDLLSNLFPRLALFRQCLRPKFVFSELNEKALCLAESIAQDTTGATVLKGAASSTVGRKCLIFTDAYVDKGNEEQAELLQRAIQLGAICLSDDVTNLKIYGVKNVTYLLMDQDETGNLNAAIALAEPSPSPQGQPLRACQRLCGKRGRDARIQILFFSQNDASADLVSKIYKKDKEGELPQENLTVKVVREDTGLVYDLLDQHPLYLPLLPKAQAGEELPPLSLLLVGTSPICREMILASYWCGQLLDPKTRKAVPLDLHIVVPQGPGQPTVAGYRNGLAQQLPGLRLNGTDPYAAFHFYPLDENGGSLDGLFRENPQLEDCCYGLVAVDHGPKNRNLAQWLQRRYALLHLGEGENPVHLFYLVEDNYLCDALNLNQAPGCTAFGKLAHRFSIASVFTPDLEDRATHGKNKDDAFLLDEYNRRSKTSSAIHAKYKIFSTAPSLLDRRGQVRQDLSPAQLSQALETCYAATDPQGRDGRDALAWLEHRRWAAYTYSIGYRAPTEEEFSRYFALNPTSDDAKYLTLKLHPCLVDSDLTHPPLKYGDWFRPSSEGFDALDRFSLFFNEQMRQKFPQDWAAVQDYAAQLPALLSQLEGTGAGFFLDEEGYLCSTDGSYLRNLGAIRKALQAHLGLTPLQAKLLIPTDYKQYDYDCIPDIPARSTSRKG
jgi:hypothetical protein